MVGSDDLPGNGKHYPHRSCGGHGGAHGTQGGGTCGPRDNPYGGDSDSYSLSEFERWHRLDWHTQ